MILFLKIVTSNIRSTSNRSIRTAVAIMLCKLRLGLSNTILAILFQLPNKRAISRAIESARTALMQNFVPNNLGFNHVTRRQIIDEHTSTISRELMCGGESDRAILVADGTYIYIQVTNLHFITFIFIAFCIRNLVTIISNVNHLIFIKNDHY